MRTTGSGCAPGPRRDLDFSVTIEFHRKKTLLDAHMLTRNPKIPQKFFPADQVSPESAEKAVGHLSLADHRILTTDYCFSFARDERTPPACPLFVSFRFPACAGMTCFAALFSQLCGIPAKDSVIVPSTGSEPVLNRAKELA